MDFKLPKPPRSSREKDAYAGNWQLINQFSKLDNILVDEYERNIVIGHGLIYSLHDFTKSKHAKSLPSDELRAYYDVLYTINSGLINNVFSVDEAVWDLQEAVDSYLRNSNPNANYSSPLLTEIINETNLTGVLNPTEILRKGANKLYSLVRSKGTLKGNRVIEGENYLAIKNAFRVV
ncbi:hypothetical protein JXA48_02855 [Candidatus Woesearchaeota archaeon]|nr:hypothetical protein [Candidatus Woesearchaeota archaeon]